MRRHGALAASKQMNNNLFMNKISTLILAMAFCAATMPSEARDIDLKSFGAKPDGKTKVTATLQKAINEVSKAGGGQVILSGGTFLTGPIELKDGVELHIEADATLLGSPDLKDYPNRTGSKHVIPENLPRWRDIALIYADEAENIAITGRGTIDANGKYFVRPKTESDKTAWNYVRIVSNNESVPRVVYFTGCRNVTVTDVTMVNQPAGWSYWIHDCDLVHFDRCKILANVEYPNNDGIHINSSRDVTVSNCFIETGDDSIIVRANNRSLHEKKVCERVTVTNCTLHSWANGIRVGWVNDGVIRDCVFSNIVMTDTNVGIVIQLPGETDSDYGCEATLIENILFSNIVMDGIYAHPISAQIADSEFTKVEAVRNIRFQGIHSRGLQFLYIKGTEKHPFENFTFSDCTFERVSDEVLPGYKEHGSSYWDRHKEETFLHAKNFVFNNTTFTTY